MPQIDVEGKHSVKIKEAKPIKHRFEEGEGCLEIKLVGVKQDGSHGTAYLPITSNYPKNDSSGKTDAELTFQKLEKLGIPNGGKELSKLEEVLLDKEVEFYAKYNNSGYMNFYVNTSKPEHEIDPSEAQKEIEKLYGDNSGGDENAQTEKKEAQGDAKEDEIPF